MNKKERFLKEFRDKRESSVLNYLAVAVRLPGGQMEIIVNSNALTSKMSYYESAYDENLCLKANPDISIVGWMIV